MVYQRRVVKRRPASLTDEEWSQLTALGRQTRPSWPHSDYLPEEVTPAWNVLCWWCRGVHLASEVEACMALPRKIATVEGCSSSTLSASDAGPLKPYSELWAFLTQTTFEDGSKRQPGKLSLSCESGNVGLSLNDGETGQYAFLEAANLTDLLKDANKRLEENRVPWRASKWASEGKRKK